MGISDDASSVPAPGRSPDRFEGPSAVRPDVRSAEPWSSSRIRWLDLDAFRAAPGVPESGILDGVMKSLWMSPGRVTRKWTAVRFRQQVPDVLKPVMKVGVLGDEAVHVPQVGVTSAASRSASWSLGNMPVIT